MKNNNPIRYILQFGCYGIFALFLASMSQQIAYQHQDPELALIKLSLSHAGQHKEECRRLSPEELAELAPNMRRPMQCNRERVPLVIEIELDNELIYHNTLQPSGLSKDGESTVYKRFMVKPGNYLITARLRDSRRTDGFEYEHSEQVMLQPRQNFVIDFKADAGGFIFL